MENILLIIPLSLLDKGDLEDLSKEHKHCATTEKLIKKYEKN